MTSFNPQHKLVLDELLLGMPALRAGKMFGFPAYYVGKKLCICLYEDGVGLKLPAEQVKNLLAHDPHVIPFQPLGKAVMREWVQINLADSAEYKDYLPIFKESVAYVQSLQKEEKGNS